MSFETAADDFIRPRIAAQATPAFAAVQREQAERTAQQTALRGHGGSEIGQQGGVETEAGEDLTFDDLLDLVNPLHHIPVVGTLYRKITGDEIKPPVQVLGGLLYGGPVGMVASAANAAIEEASGGDLGDAVYAMVFGPDDASPPDLATTDPATADPAAVAAAAQTAPAAGPAEATAFQPGHTESAPAAQAIPVAVTAPTAAPTAAADGVVESIEDGADPAAQLPPVPAGALTGKAALDAFLNDLAGVGRAAQADGLPAEAAKAALPNAALQAPPAAAQSMVPAAAQIPVAAPVAAAAQQVSARPEQPTRSGDAREARANTATDATAVPANLQDLGLRDRRGNAKPAPAVPYNPAAQPGATAARADRTAEPGITIRPGRASAGVDPRFLAPAPDNTAPLIDSGSTSESNTGDFSQQMLQALQKYEDMLTARRSNARS